MPHLFFAGTAQDEKPSPSPSPSSVEDGLDDRSSDKENVWGRTWKQMGNWLKKEDETEPPPQAGAEKKEKKDELNEKVPCQEAAPTRPAHAVIPGVPRPLTFKRQDSERRERLYPHEPDHEERRATSADRRLGTSYERKLSPCPLPRLAASPPKLSTIESATGSDSVQHAQQAQQDFASTAGTVDGEHSDRHDQDLDTHSQYDWAHHDVLHHHDQLSDALDDLQIQSELEAKWILNLSMHFRDHSEREKFFVTYAEEPNKWRRVTVSCDYRHAPEDSLEADLKSLHYQRDKSARIYEAIRDSLPQIQFYQTVTNLKLETSDGRLHVHVTEDVNEIIEYPTLFSVAHLELPTYSERTIEFDCHMSGFVYKVKTSDGGTFIKKEIPGPEAVEEFLYEINALSSLRDSPSVVHLEGLVVDEHGYIKGILLNYCEQGALVDLIYDLRHTDRLTWPRRLRWARQIVEGLAEIHEAGFVQGDFTLSNIVICQADNAHIIDINRRGCPIGWEPPELSRLIQAGHRISMYIGVKSDIFQLGMVLWGLAEQQDEPERQERPLRFRNPDSVPQWYREIVEICLSPTPRERLLAKELLAKFPPVEEAVSHNGYQAPTIAIEEIPAEESAVEATVVPEMAHPAPEDAPRNPSPIYSSTPANIDTDVEYLVTSLEPDKRADSAADSYNHGEPITQANGAITGAAAKENTAQDEMKPEDHYVSQCPPQQAQPCGLIREMHLAAIAKEAAEATRESLTSVDQSEAKTSTESQPDNNPSPPSHTDSQSNLPSAPTTIAPVAPQPIATSALATAVTSITSRPFASPSLSLGSPTLATFSPSPSQSERLTPDKSDQPAAQPPFVPMPIEVMPKDIPSHRTSPAVDLGSPPLATFSPPPASTSVPPPDVSTDRSLSLNLGNPPLATISPLSAPTSAPRQDPIPAQLSPSVSLGNPPLASISPMPTATAIPQQEGETSLSSAISIGNPPLATMSPPPVLGAPHAAPTVTDVQPEQSTLHSMMESSPVPPVKTAATEHKPERTNTLGLELAKHHDSGFDEPASSTSGTPISPARFLTTVEEQPGMDQSAQDSARNLEGR